MRHAVNGSQQGDRDVLISLVRQLRQIRDEDAAADASTALDVFVDHLVPVVAPRLIPIAVSLAVEELERRGWRPAPTLADRLRPLTPNGERVLGAFAAVLTAALIVAVIALVVWSLT